jgi:hypothetical protein
MHVVPCNVTICWTELRATNFTKSLKNFTLFWLGEGKVSALENTRGPVDVSQGGHQLRNTAVAGEVMRIWTLRLGAGENG